MESLEALIARAWHALLGARPEWVAVALALYVMALLLSSARWRVLVRALGGRLGWSGACMAVVSGVCVNNITPTGRLGGEACRLAVTRLKGEVSLTRGALAAVLDRLADVPPIALMTLVGLPAVPTTVGGTARAWLVALLVGLVVALLAGRWIRRAMGALLTSGAREGVSLSAVTLAQALVLSTVVWAEDVLRLMAVGLAFGVSLSVPQASAVGVAALFSSFVPTIGGLGAVEGALVGVLALLGVPLETAIAMTTVERLVTYGVSTTVGGAIVLSLGGRRLWTAASGPSGDGRAPGGGVSPYN